MSNSNRPLRIAVLLSGSGSNLQALIDACTTGLIPGQIVQVISNVADAYGLERARKAQIPTCIIPHQGVPRIDFDQAMRQALEDAEAELICLAGFMRILTAKFVQHYEGRILNIHPALLPAFPGIHVQKKAIEAGVRFSGATVHFVVPKVDAGPIVIQAVVPVLADDDPKTLAARILRQEHRIYPLAVRWFAQKRLRLEKGRVWIQGGTEREETALINPSEEAQPKTP